MKGIFGEEVRPGQITKAHEAMAAKAFAPDARNVKILGAISEAYKALSEKMFEKNPVMHALINSQMDLTSVFQYPVCGKCETVALWNMPKFDFSAKTWEKTCGCMRCGSITTKPATVRQWLKDELKHKVGPDYLDLIDIGVDRIAMQMMKVWIDNLVSDVQQENGYSEPDVEVDHEKIL